MRPKPTLARVNKMIKCSHFAFERDDIRLEWIDVLKAYIAQEEELEGVKGELDAERIVLNHHSQMIDQLKEKGEQLCCRVGVLEMENQALKASMEAEYIERQAKHIQELVKENEALKELAKGCAAKPRAMQDLMKKHGLAIRDHDDPMQKLAFTLYTELVESAVSARDLLEGEQP